MRRAIRFIGSLCSNQSCKQLSGQQDPRKLVNRPPTLEALEERAQPSAGSVTLGTASQFALLGLDETWLINSGVTINGNEGVSRHGMVDNERGSTINGDVDEYSKNQYTGHGKLNGNLNTSSSLMNQADADAKTASAAAAALAPTQTFKSINRATTITGNGGLNVININGDISASLTLSGSASDVFIINVKGDLSLHGTASLNLSGGVTASNVLYNFVGRHGSISTHSHTVVNGTLLALRYDVSINGVVNGEVIAGGDFVGLGKHATINQMSFNGGGSTGTPGISGVVYDDLNGDGILEPGEPGMAGVVVTLTGTDANGNSVTLSATTDVNGAYSFTGLTAGTYSLQRNAPSSFFNGGSTVGTVNGTQDGTIQFDGSIGQIAYQAGGVGTGYNFAELPVATS
jgi:hypothetical protein